eukprot:CAMPEP_0118879638 /NCGR_PEP_ID=MMETSP1163-20130328/19393_1 /TAXON_ID=124430 /ORGANISM="Phaeomonas parva, Strain CCMP2877" /LENGTH=52 /DNA_ID=CAMNT_0006815841 /DNA_START=161 /DNA_END=319 /DNA_ORIENTATION=+
MRILTLALPFLESASLVRGLRQKRNVTYHPRDSNAWARRAAARAQQRLRSRP